MNNCLSGMQAVRASATYREIHIIPYSHADYAWTHYRQWHIERYILILKEVLGIMDENPDFTWMTDNINHILLPLFKYCPDLFEKFKQRVLEGRLEITNGILSLLRPTQAGGETFIRNIALGRRFLEELIPGFDTKVYHSVDVAIGHSQMPQLLKLGGYSYYRAWRPQGALDAKGIPREFAWKGLDGTVIICSRGTYAGLCGIEYMNSDFDENWDEIADKFYHKELKKILNLSTSTNVWLSCGMDDTRPLQDYNDEPSGLQNFIDEWNKRERYPAKFSTAGAYFKGLDENGLKTVSDVLDGCDVGYNTPTKGESGLWRIRQMLERTILKVETLSSFAVIYGENYPEHEIKELWHSLLGICGHAMEFVLDSDYERLLKEARAAEYKAESLLEEAKAKLAQKVDGRKQLVIFNILGWDRKEIVPLHISFPEGCKGFKLMDAKGKILEYQVCGVYKGDIPYKNAKYDEIDILANVSIPAMGYTCVAVNVEDMNNYAESFGMEAEDIDFKIAGSGSQTVDTGNIKVEFSSGRIKKVVDKSGKTVFDQDECNCMLNDLRFIQVNHHSRSAWLFFSNYQSMEHFVVESWEWQEYGPLRWKYVVSGRIGKYKAQQVIILCKGAKTVDFSVDLDCMEPVTGFFSAVFPADFATPITAGIPFGAEERNITGEPYGKLTDNIIDNIERTWKGLFYANEWVNYRLGGRSVSLVGETTGQYYLYDDSEESIAIMLTRVFNLKRSEDWVRHMHPSSECRGRNNFKYSLVVQNEENDDVSVARLAKEKIFRPEAGAKLGCTFAGNIPRENSMVEIHGESVLISAFYMDGGKFIIRMYEAGGKDCRTVVTPSFKFDSVEAVDLCGKPLYNAGLVVNGDKGNLSLEFKPGEIITIRIA